MIALANRITLMVRLGQYFEQLDEVLEETITLAYRNNAWFTPEYVRFSLASITQSFLQKEALENWLSTYPKIENETLIPKEIGIVMAGNIPLVGFHDFLCIFMAGHKMKIKLSTKDTTLWKHILAKLQSWNPEFEKQVEVSEMLKGCDAYIATGSNNTSRYFEYYFEKYPHIIRKNRSSVAVLNGNETEAELDFLSEDVNLYFGLGCRNVTQLFVPKDYNFEPLLAAMNRYKAHIEHNKFKNNYDHQLALFLLNKQYYMTNGHLLLVESEQVYAPIAVLHYQYYNNESELLPGLLANDQIQCVSMSQPYIADAKLVKFGLNQSPGLMDYADGVDTMQFLEQL